MASVDNGGHCGNGGNDTKAKSNGEEFHFDEICALYKQIKIIIKNLYTQETQGYKN